MGGILSILCGWKGWIALFVAGAIMGAGGTWRVMSWRASHQQVKVLTKTIEKVKLQPVVTERVVTKYINVRDAAAKHTQDLILEIPNHVPPDADARFPVSCGFVRVFNDAWHGPVPDPSRCPDGAAADIALSAVAGAEAVNGGNYDQVVHQLIALQEWIKEQQKLSEK